MKIRRLQITIEPRYPVTVAGCPGYQTMVVEVRTDCGNILSSIDVFHENHFQDIFGFVMKEAEHRIRKMIQEKSTPADNKV